MTARRKSFVNPEAAHNRPAYRKTLLAIEREGVCPFCPEPFLRYNRTPIIRTGQHWVLTDNRYPYKGAKHHLLLVHKQHIEHLSEISPAAWRELDLLVKYITSKRAIKGAALVLRFGDPAYTGASVRHLHANLIGGAGADKNRKPILFRVG